MALQTRIHCDPAVPAALREALQAALDRPPQRVQRVAAGGKAVWIKQAEVLSLRWRLQKGNPLKSLEAERAGLHDLADMGLPVVPLVAEGPGFLATLEVGRPLSAVLTEAQSGTRPFAAAGAALAALHSAGVAHGRPSLRDMLWDGAQVRFIDFERYRPGPARDWRMALDLLIFLHSVAMQAGADAPELDAGLQAWREGVPDRLANAAGRLVRRLGFLKGVARLVLQWRPGARDWRPVPALLIRLAHLLP